MPYDIPPPKNLPEPGYYYHFKHDPAGPLNNYAYYPGFAVCGRPPPRKVFCSALIRSLAPVCPAYLRART